MAHSELLITLSWASLILGLLSAAAIAADIAAGRRQRMAIMNLVWILTALYSGPLALYAYFRTGRTMTKDRPKRNSSEKPFWQTVALATSHCGSGCTLGDLIAESTVLFFPIVLFGHKIFGTWLLDFVLAFGFGIVFQYFTIAPMKHLGFKAGLIAAVKADSASLAAWQIGMYGWMAVVTFLIFGREMDKSDPVFWFMMQIAMILGFLTSFPVNWWLVRAGLKERM